MMLLASSSKAAASSSSSMSMSMQRCTAPSLRAGVARRPALARRQQQQQRATVAVAAADANADNDDTATTPSTSSPSSGEAEAASSVASVDKEVARLARSAATTFAPRASGATGKNPAHKGSTLYAIFGAQAWLSVVAGGLLSFNVLFPSDEPSIARLIGMWSVWMFTVPALRARECGPAEKEALNLLFLLIPLANVTIPIFAKSFPLVFSADVLLLFGVLAWKGAAPWQEEAKEEA